MNLINKILKKIDFLNTANTREEPKNTVIIDQLNTLNKLLRKAHKTEFGKKYHFNSILVQKNTYESYNKLVPIHTYEKHYQEWIWKMLNDNSNVCWPGNINFYALSSGTTEDRSKFIPITKDYIKSCKKITKNLFIKIYKSGHKLSFTKNTILIIGGSSHLNKEKSHYTGDLSGIFALNRPKWSKIIVKPNPTISKIQDWNQRIDAIAREAVHWNIELIIGNIAWIQYLIENILKKHNLQSIHQIWPKFSLIISGGIFIDSYIPIINQYCKRPLHFINTFIASEGFFAIQFKDHYNQFKFNTKNRILFEFIEYNPNNFTKDGNLKLNAKCIMIKSVKVNTTYSLVISNNSGLWRYHMGDLIKFIDTKEFIFEIIGRTKQCLSEIGEHLTIDELNLAVQRSSLLLNFHVQEFTLMSKVVNNEYEHHWYFTIKSSKSITETELEQSLDTELISINDDYSTIRKSLIKKVKVHFIQKEVFYNWLASKGKLNGQSKIPRIMTGAMKESWLQYVSPNS